MVFLFLRSDRASSCPFTFIIFKYCITPHIIYCRLSKNNQFWNNYAAGAGDAEWKNVCESCMEITTLQWRPAARKNVAKCLTFHQIYSVMAGEDIYLSRRGCVYFGYSAYFYISDNRVLEILLMWTFGWNVHLEMGWITRTHYHFQKTPTFTPNLYLRYAFQGSIAKQFYETGGLWASVNSWNNPI